MLSPHRAPLKRGTKAGSLLVHQLTAPLPRSGFVHRLHGGLSTGPRTSEGLARIRAARTTHGMRTAEMEGLRALVRELRAGAKRLVEMT
jgi:hypothetical protein